MGELSFRAMGSDAHVIVVGGAANLPEDARRRIDELERRWSRFLPDSEVSELTRRAGDAVPVSDDTIELVRRAIEASVLSGGSFDASVLGDVIRAGYDRTFDDLGPTPPAGSSSLRASLTDPEVEGNLVRLPAGTGFDPGGIGKGLAADIVVHELRTAGAEGACVNLGGDLRVSGVSPTGDGWTIALEHPLVPAPIGLVGIADGGVATSTTLRRRWRVEGTTRHHLIDPGTGQPAETDLELVTVIASQAWVAEVMAKAILLRGSEHPFDLIDGDATVAMAVTDEGAVLVSDGFDAFLGGADLPASINVDPPVT